MQATLLVTDGDKQLMLMGNGDLIEHGEGDSVMGRVCFSQKQVVYFKTRCLHRSLCQLH